MEETDRDGDESIEELIQHHQALSQICSLSGLQAIRQIFEHGAAAIKDRPLPYRTQVVGRGTIMRQECPQRTATEITIELPEIVRRIGDSGVAPVDDAGNLARCGRDQDML